MSTNQAYLSYTKNGVYVGKYFRNMKSVKFEAAHCAYLKDAAEKVVQLAQSYQLPVQMTFDKKTITIPVKNMKTYSVQDVVNAYLENTDKNTLPKNTKSYYDYLI